jgi:hypothetical protein
LLLLQDDLQVLVFETSLLLARKGFYTYATMRNLNKSQRINDIAEKENLPLKVLQLDVTDDKSVKDALDKSKKQVQVLMY